MGRFLSMPKRLKERHALASHKKLELATAFFLSVSNCLGIAFIYELLRIIKPLPVFITAAIEDLNNTINLSGGKGRSACLAFCQRAIIYRLQNKQQEAVADFEKAAALGSAFARSQLVLMNPYAALCNQMLRKVLSQYR
ncbi:tetratricopeptide repeat protein 36 [Trichonephila clavata]|uniref:Tetratricopeptide repeat protein 36 n=1 Tax=Trichonephila clavata TaxID=2740835 RepID=A0A8X6HG51_TRICU|nr:tetratricopeptide repeat protein 36 [Trichonephila clavata]